MASANGFGKAGQVGRFSCVALEAGVLPKGEEPAWGLSPCPCFRCLTGAQIAACRSVQLGPRWLSLLLALRS